MEDKEKQPDLPDDDRVVFIPSKDMQAIERTLRNIEQAQQEFRKVQESMEENIILPPEGSKNNS